MNKKHFFATSAILFTILVGCASKTSKEETYTDTVDRLSKGNEKYTTASYNSGDISEERRQNTATNGQEPYAVVITCSDSRVIPEHIFNAGVGELFVIRTAGNVIAEFELGSIEYGAKHLNAGTIIVMGHTGCGAVDSAIKDNAHGNIKTITDEIRKGIGDETSSVNAEIKNIEQSVSRIIASEVIQKLILEKKVIIKGAMYNTNTGKVSFL